MERLDIVGNLKSFVSSEECSCDWFHIQESIVLLSDRSDAIQIRVKIKLKTTNENVKRM